MKKLFLIFAILFLTGITSLYAEEPVLPVGLGGEESEDNSHFLPSGLGSDEPSLPEGLFGESSSELEPEKESFTLPFELSGFAEGRMGGRLQDDSYEDEKSLAEARLQLELEKQWSLISTKITADFIYDNELETHRADLEEGRGWVNIREAHIGFSPFSFMDVKVGRQILTWGTGDLIFINDLFPKDWNSFILGRDQEYLKAPSDAVKVSLFSSFANIDIIYSPYFDSDRFVDGTRVSYWNSMLNRRAGRDLPVVTDKPDKGWNDDELALRIFRNIKGYEFAIYGYKGFWKSPGGMDIFSGKALFPNLEVYGASLRGNMFKGIASIEVGYYHSENDKNGDNPFINNSEIRLLLGYEQELATDFTGGFQYYLERMDDYSNYENSLLPGALKKDENRHVLTMRLTKMLMSQNLTISLVTFYSPSDNDFYVRQNVHYKINDNWSAELGGGYFGGKDDYTFYSQFENNSNLYAVVRYSFTL